jgi:hypothetical protein
MEVSGQPHAPSALPRGKGLRYQLGSRLGGWQGQYLLISYQQTDILMLLLQGYDYIHPMSRYIMYTVLSLNAFWRFLNNLHKVDKPGCFEIVLIGETYVAFINIDGTRHKDTQSDKQNDVISMRYTKRN